MADGGGSSSDTKLPPDSWVADIAYRQPDSRQPVLGLGMHGQFGAQFGPAADQPAAVDRLDLTAACDGERDRV